MTGISIRVRFGALFSILCMLLTSLVMAQTTPQMAPVNPQYLAYRFMLDRGLLRAAPDEYPFGYVPPLVDISRITQPISSIQRPRLGLPPAYDLRTANPAKLTAVRNQGAAGSCWAFATYASLESCLLPGETWDFSENNLKNTHGFDWLHDAGGNALMSMAYLTRWSGPIREQDDPYKDYSGSSPDGLMPVKHIQDVLVLPRRASSTDNDTVKQAVMDYGAVFTSYRHDDAYYYSASKTYRYTGSLPSNHAVAIVGWDDAKSVPGAPSPGAFIIKNSWGASWGEAGYFYISYYDSKLGYDGNYVFHAAATTDNYSFVYQYDPLGWVVNMDASWGANVFTAEHDEMLSAVGFYAVNSNMPYEVRVYTTPTSGPVTGGTLQATMTGTFQYAGYHTLTLPTPVPLLTGQKFSVVVRLTGDMYPTAVELHYPGYSSSASAQPGQSYYSYNGVTFSDLTGMDPTANCCIKAYTTIVVDEPTIFGFTPTSGCPETVVTISGAELTGAFEVRFNDVPALCFTVDSPYQITAVAPRGATTGPISVLTPGGAAVSTENFVVNPAGIGAIVFHSNYAGFYDIYMMLSNGAGMRQISDGFYSRDQQPALSRDGQKIVFVSNRFETGNPNTPYGVGFYNNIFTMNANGSALTQLTTDSGHNYVPAFSPDGRKIAFSSTRDGVYEIYIMNANGSNQTRLTHNSANDYAPSFSPDGKKIVFESTRDNNREIYIMDVNGANQTRLTSTWQDEYAPSFTPDGQRIVFESYRDGNAEIYIMNVDGTGQTRLTNDPRPDKHPSVSADGQKIVFCTTDSSNTDIYVMNINGSGRTRLTTAESDDAAPHWGGGNAPALGVDDSYTILEDETLIVPAPGVLANDIDTDGNTLTAAKYSDPAHGDLTFNADGSFTYHPLDYYTGTDTFQYTIHDGNSYSAPVTVTITITPVDNPPSFVSGGDVVTNEDTPYNAQWATQVKKGLGPDDDNQTLTFIVIPAKPDLFTAGGQPAISPTGVLTFTPALNVHGSTLVVVSLTDQTFTTTPTVFSITINPVNDTPSFTKGGDIRVLQSAGPQTVIGWATAISPGPDDEKDQAVDFLVSNNNNALFANQPAISPTGTLTFTPAENASGVATVTVRIHDNGGGADTSAPQTFTITVYATLSGVTLQADASNVPDAGHTLMFTAQAINGMDPVYNFDVKLKDILPDGTYATRTIVPLAASYSATNTCAFLAEEPGVYTVTAYCRENGTTKTHKRSLTYQVGTTTLRGIASLTADKPSGISLAEIPQGITLTATVNGSGNNVEYFFSAKLKDIDAAGAYVYVQQVLSTAWSTDNTVKWEPTEPGTYTLMVTARDATCNVSYTKTLTFTVFSPTVTGIRSLTADPVSGVVLDALPPAGITLTTLVDGTGENVEYRYAATLKDIHADGSYTTVDQQWESAWSTDNTWQWEPTEPGTYTITVMVRDATYNTLFTRKITYLVKSPTVTGILTLTANPTSGTVIAGSLPLNGITLTAMLTGTGEDVEYFFSAKWKDMQADGSFTYIPVALSSEYSLSNIFNNWRPTLPGTYTVTVIARDRTYNTSYSKTLTFLVKSPTVTEITGLTANQPSGIAIDDLPGGIIRLTATISGTGAGVQYFFSARLKDIAADGTSTFVPVTLSSAWSPNSFFDWQPTEPGSYTLTVMARDGDYDTVYTKSLTFLVRPAALKLITSLAADQPSGIAVDDIPGGNIRLTASVDGTGAGVQYFFSAKLKDIAADGSYTSVPVTLSSAWSTNSFFDWQPTEPGTYTLTVTARDASCNTSCTKSLTFLVRPATLKAITGVTANPASGAVFGSLPGQGIRLTAAVSGSGVGVEYFFSAKLKDGQSDGSYIYEPVTLSLGYSTDNFIDWQPSEPGAYTITVTARDATCNTTVSKTISYTLLSPAVQNIASFTPNIPSGSSLGAIPPQGIRFTTLVTGSGVDVSYRYKVEYLLAGIYQLVGLSDLTTAVYDHIPANGAGTYRLTVYAYDPTYNLVYNRSITYILNP